MERIDPAAVPEMFRRNGLRPDRQAFVTSIEGRRCCILSALAVDAGRLTLEQISGIDSDNETRQAAEMVAGVIGMDPDYARGLYHGWDLPDRVPYAPATPFQVGKRDGAAAWRACTNPD